LLDQCLSQLHFNHHRFYHDGDVTPLEKAVDKTWDKAEAFTKKVPLDERQEGLAFEPVPGLSMAISWPANLGLNCAGAAAYIASVAEPY
jgi:hypothetical protein